MWSRRRRRSPAGARSDGTAPSEGVEALPTIYSRCEEIGRDPSTLAISVHIWPELLAKPGKARIEQLAQYAKVGVSRVMALLRESARSDDALESLASDARRAGVELA